MGTEQEGLLLRELIYEIVRQCDDGKWCLFTKRKGKDGKRRRLGTHDSKEGAYRQERAINLSEGTGSRQGEHQDIQQGYDDNNINELQLNTDKPCSA